jgi:NADH-quinone oxidoreductase subunit I
MYCDLCIEACPTKAISWDKNYEFASYFKEDMTYDALVEARNRRGNNE